MAMKKGLAAGLTAGVLAAVLGTGCGTWNKHAEVDSKAAASEQAPESVQAAAKMNASLVTEVSFGEASADLTDDARTALKNMVADAKKRGEIDEIKVVAWADQEYPANQQSQLSRADRELAKRRADSVEQYLKNALEVSDVDTYNMAERPNSLENLLNTSDAQVKNGMEAAGIPTTASEARELGKASRAVVMVIMED